MENNNKKSWYQKKRYIIPLGLLGLFIVLGFNGVPSTQQIKSDTVAAPSYQSPIQVPQTLSVTPQTTPQPENFSNDNQ